MQRKVLLKYERKRSIYLDEMDAIESAEEAYAADDHPLQEYSDTAADVAETGWETQERISAENYYDDGTRLIMDYFLNQQQK